MRILVTGASGFVGKYVCDRLREDQHEVWAAVRQLGSAPKGTREFVVGDLSDEVDWKDSLDGVDSVIHLAARVHAMDDEAGDPSLEYRRINVSATLRLAECAHKLGVKRFVFMSSIAVNGKRSESAPFDVDSGIAPAGPYGRSKWEAEKALTALAREREMTVISVRAPMVYGPDAPGNIRRLIRLALTGIPVPLGRVQNKRTLISVRNLADLLAHCATQGGLGSGLVVAGDSYSPSTAELFSELARSLGRRPRIWPLPIPILSVISRVAGRSDDLSRLIDSLEVRNSATVRGLSWKPNVSFQEAIRELGMSVNRGSKQ